MEASGLKMQSLVVILFITFAAVCAKQDSGQKEQSNLNSLEGGSRLFGSKRISRELPKVDASSDSKGDVANSLDSTEDVPNELGVMDEDLRTFHGTHPQQFEQLMDLLAIKGQLKQKASSCTLRDICTHWGNKSFVTKHADHVKKWLKIFAAKKNTFSGAMANGWLRENCTKIYDSCETFVRVVTSLDGNNSLDEYSTTSASIDLKKLPEKTSAYPPSA